MSLKLKGDGGRDLRISFLHGFTTIKSGKNAGKEKKFVECHLLHAPPEGEDGKIQDLVLLGQGVAVCSFQDQFSSEEGRKIALFRAAAAGVKSGKISPDERAKILRTYFMRKKLFHSFLPLKKKGESESQAST